MGLRIIDNCELEELTAACEKRQRWTFLFTAAPIPWIGATGSPVNPLAVL
jgi:hypothetical protein